MSLNLSKFLFLNRSKGEKIIRILEIILTKRINYIYTRVATHTHVIIVFIGERRFTFVIIRHRDEGGGGGFRQIGSILENVDRNDFFLRCIKRNIPFFSSSIVAAAFISWFRYFMEAFDTVRCFGSRVYRGRLEMRSRES